FMVDTESGRPIKRLEVHAEDGRLLAPGDTRLADFRNQENR
ncbi:MAG: transcriptional regulator, partial [Mesorhizobium sp.]